jgi:hypothetical protein
MKTISFLSHNVKKIIVSVDKIEYFLFDKTKYLYKSIQSLSGSIIPPEIPVDRIKYPNSRYDFVSEFLIEGYNILLKRTSKGKEIKLILLQPDKYIQDILLPVFTKHKVKPILSSSEITQDLYPETKEENIILGKDIKKSLIQPYNRHKSFVYLGESGSETLYTVDKRNKKGLRESKSAKSYLRNTYDNQKDDKGIKGKPFARIELTLNRAIMKDSGWQYPITSDQILKLQVNKYNKFVRFDYPKFEKYILHPDRSYDKRLLERKMRRKIERLKTYPVYKVIEILKSVKIPHYKYILPLNHEDNVLQESLNQWKGYDDVAPNQRVKLIKRKKLKDKLVDESSSTPSYTHTINPQKKGYTMNDKLLLIVRKNIISINKDIQKKQGKIGSHKMIALARLLSVYTKMKKMDKEEKMIVPQQSYYDQIEQGKIKMKQD